MAFKIRGVHPIEAPEPCHLIHVELPPASSSYEWGAVTQEVAGQFRDNWQVPWDEQPLEDSDSEWVFFFHYLDMEKPLLTPDGPVLLPTISPLPDRLKLIAYEEP